MKSPAKGMFLLSALLLTAMPVHAYIDPGTGSLILQGLLAGLVVAAGAIRMWWYRIKAFLGLEPRDDGQSAPSAKDPAQSDD